MYAFQRFSCPSFFHPSTNRRMYRLLSNRLIGEPCGLPRPSSRLRVLRCLFPPSSVSSTGASSHILIRCSMAPSTTRRATDFRSSECGRVSKEPTTHYSSSEPPREGHHCPRSPSLPRPIAQRFRGDASERSAPSLPDLARWQ